MPKIHLVVDQKAFNLLRREGEPDAGSPRSRYNYAKDVGDGLGSSTIVATALWVARQFPEARVAIQDRDGELHHDHPLPQLINRPNRFYGSGALSMSVALDYVIQGNGYWEIGRGRDRKPVALYYQPSYQVAPMGTDTELITHYEQQTKTGPRRIDVRDTVHFRMGLNSRDQKRGMSPLYCLLREVFTDDEAANFTAAVLRNFGFPGVMISAADENASIGPARANRIKKYFRRMFRGDQRGDVLVTSARLKMDTLDIDLSKLNLDKLRAIPEERVTAVMGIPAAVVGFGTGLEQTKVGATMKELRELAYENVIVPMQRNFAEELESKLLPEFESNPQDFRVVFDNSEVRVLQEDESRKAERAVRLFQGGLFTRAMSLRMMGEEATPADDVYRVGMADVLVPVGQMPTRPEPVTRALPGWVTKAIGLKGQTERDALNQRFLADARTMSAEWADDLARQFERIGEELAAEYQRSSALVLAGRNGHQTKASEPTADERDVIDRMLTGRQLELDYAPQFLRIAKRTLAGIKEVIGLAVNLDDPMERAVIAEGGTRLGLVDLTEQTRASMYTAVAEAREAGLGPADTARRIRDGISAGPWGSVQTRAMVIARTETKFAQNFAAMETYQKADTVTGIQVFDAQLGDTDANCQAIAGQIFSVAEARMIPMLDHPNCTRVFAPVVE